MPRSLYMYVVEVRKNRFSIVCIDNELVKVVWEFLGKNFCITKRIKNGTNVLINVRCSFIVFYFGNK